MNKRLVVIDGFAILHRAYYAIPPLTNGKGEQINAVYGVVSILLKVIQDLKPTHLAFAFDRKEPTFRNKISKEYQSQRPEKDESLVSQIEITRKVIEAFGIPVYSLAGFEADDVIGTIARKATTASSLWTTEKEKAVDSSSLTVSEVVIVTGDRDILQLVTPRVKVYMPIQGLSKAKLFGEKEVLEKMGVKANQVDDYKALVGDQSDNYKGVPGIGPKTAEKLLVEYGTFENIYENINKISPQISEKLKKGEESGRESKKLATIVKDVPLDFNLADCEKWDIGRKEVIDEFRNLGFKTLLSRVMTLSGKDATPQNSRKNLSLGEVEKIVAKLAQKLEGKQYAIRGSASLFLQGIKLKVDDIDVVCDEETALLINDIFKDLITDTVKYSESDKFKSYFGKMILDGILIEIYGEWQINLNQNSKILPGQAGKSQKWSTKYTGEDGQVNIIDVEGEKVRVTKPEVELSCFAQMGRWNAYQIIKKSLEEKNQGVLF